MLFLKCGCNDTTLLVLNIAHAGLLREVDYTFTNRPLDYDISQILYYHIKMR